MRYVHQHCFLLYVLVGDCQIEENDKTGKHGLAIIRIEYYDESPFTRMVPSRSFNDLRDAYQSNFQQTLNAALEKTEGKLAIWDADKTGSDNPQFIIHVPSFNPDTLHKIVTGFFIVNTTYRCFVSHY